LILAAVLDQLAETIPATPLDPALKVMAMKDEAIVLTAAVIRLLSPTSTNAANWHT